MTKSILYFLLATLLITHCKKLPDFSTNPIETMYDGYVPATPHNLNVKIKSGGITLIWEYSAPSYEVQGFHVYRQFKKGERFKRIGSIQNENDPSEFMYTKLNRYYSN